MEEHAEPYVAAKDPSKQIVLFKMPVDDISKWCALPGVIYASDAMMVPGGWDDPPAWDTPYEQIPNTHPRLAGTHGRCFRMARENDVPLMRVIANSSYNPAKHLGDMGLKSMQERGRLQSGMVADITVLDPGTIKDNSTYEQGTLPTTGIPHVIVNGVDVVRDSKAIKGVTPGQAIRFPVQEKGRFEPLSVEDWEATFIGSPMEFGGLDAIAQ